MTDENLILLAIKDNRIRQRPAHHFVRPRRVVQPMNKLSPHFTFRFHGGNIYSKVIVVVTILVLFVLTAALAP